MSILRWIDTGWWKYLFQNLDDVQRAKIEWFADSRHVYIYVDLPWKKLFGEESLWERVSCRARGHPEGEIFYNVGGYEPDHHCRTCGEDLG